nr:tRNA lysidine(34) synthetase TilS [uncultured Mogibacterium sp.]
MNKIIKKIIDSRTIEYGDSVIVGFSGGSDSLTLLHALASLKEKFDLNLYAVHINHKIRPHDCEVEAEHAQTICEEIEVEFRLFECDCKELAARDKISEEEAGRNVRYEAFSRVAEEIEQKGIAKDRIKIAVAQNSDDQVETVLFHILRGTAVHGLAGIPLRRHDEHGFEVVRPLLNVGRSEVDCYVSEFGLKPNIDASNEKPIYSRNKIRLELIPELEREYNPSIRKAIAKLSEAAACDDDFMMQKAVSIYESMRSGTHEYTLNKLIGMHEALKRRVASLMLEDESVHPTYELVNSIVGVIESENPSAMYNLPGGVTAERRYERLVFLKNESMEESSIDDALKDSKEISLSAISISEYKKMSRSDMLSNESADHTRIYAVFDLDKVAKAKGHDTSKDTASLISMLEIITRTRRQGDYIGTGNGSKKLQDFLVDEKIARTSRDDIKLATIGSEILWILPDEKFKSDRYKIKGKYSQNYQIDNSSERVLFLELR